MTLSQPIPTSLHVHPEGTRPVNACDGHVSSWGIICGWWNNRLTSWFQILMNWKWMIQRSSKHMYSRYCSAIECNSHVYVIPYHLLNYVQASKWVWTWFGSHMQLDRNRYYSTIRHQTSDKCIIHIKYVHMLAYWLWQCCLQLSTSIHCVQEIWPYVYSAYIGTSAQSGLNLSYSLKVRGPMSPESRVPHIGFRNQDTNLQVMVEKTYTDRLESSVHMHWEKYWAGCRCI